MGSKAHRWVQWSYWFGQLIGRFEVDFAVSTSVNPRDIRLGRLPGTAHIALTLVADYEGRSLAADENTGNLYSETFELTAYLGDANIAARIIGLEGRRGRTRDWFQHDSQDVGTIFLSRN